MFIQLIINKKIALVNTDTIIKIADSDKKGCVSVYFADQSRIELKTTVKQIMHILSTENIRILETGFNTP